MSKKSLFKNCMLVFFLFLSIFLQVKYNSEGYNFYLIVFMAMMIVYFNDIKSISAGVFKLEKYEEIAKHIDESIISFYKSNLSLSINQRKTCFAQENILWNNYKDVLELLEAIEKLPEHIRNKLSVKYDNAIIIAIKYQERLLEESHVVVNEPKVDIKEFKDLKISPKVASKEDFQDAKCAYEALYMKYKKAIK